MTHELDEYTPTTEEMREYVEVGGEPRPWQEQDDEKDARRVAAFDRWIEAHDAEIRADQIEKDADIADDAPGSDATGYYAGDHISGYNEAVNHIATAIRAQLAPREAPELFPGVNAALAALTIIRKDGS